MKARIFLSLILLVVLCVSGYKDGLTGAGGVRAQTTTIELEPVLSGLTSPVFMTNAGDGTHRLFIVERGGIIRVLQPGATATTVFLNITTRVLSGGEQGLLGLAFHPFYRNNGRFFVYYTRPPDGALVIAEYSVSASNPNQADTAEKIILTIPHPTFTNHNGGTILFGHDGYLYAGPGDGGSGNDPSNNAQNINQLLGKILRIDIDHPNGAVPYSSPSDNPFFGSTPGRDEIFAVGLRNPYRFSVDGRNGQLMVADVGQGQLEEINIVTLGGNYGWRVFEGTQCTGLDPPLCIPGNFVFPIDEYGHTGGRCSVTGGYVHLGSRDSLPFGSYVYGDFCTGEIFLFNNGSRSLLLDTTIGISSFGEDEALENYVVGLGGTLHRIANPNAACSINVFGANQSFSAAGGTRTLVVSAPPDCNWTASTANGFITINSGANGTGYGFVQYTVAANPTTAPRTGQINISGQLHPIPQGASFSDVPVAQSFFTEIGRLSARGVTVGCGGGNYCPDQPVTREQMAVFIIRAFGIFNPPEPAMQRFVDVGPERFGYAFIEELAQRGITVGCAADRFCPDDPVTRDQMAVFMIRAQQIFNPPTPTIQRFTDVPPSSFAYAFIEEMFRRGITRGCGANIYCPQGLVTRDQMAAFLVRAFSL